MKFNLEKVDWVKVAGTAGTVLSLGAALLSNWSTQKTTNATIKEEVAKAIAAKEN